MRTRSLSMLTATIAVAGGLTLGVANASAADEGEVSVNGGTLVFEAAAGDVANNVTLSQPAAARFVVRDTGAPVSAGDGCVQVEADRVRCAAAGITEATLDLGPGADVARVLAALPARLEGDTGNDRLTGGPLDDALDGDEGNDRLRGGAGADTLEGDEGADNLDGEAGPDAYHGGDGADTATYAGRTEPVTVTIDDVADDGGASDAGGDNVATDVERLIGGDAADSLSGSEVANTLDGGPGGDLLAGLAGADTVTYATRTEAVTVAIDGLATDGGASDGAADDVAADVENLVGGRGDDSLTGSAAANRLTGGLGADVLRGLGRNDVLVAKDGVADAELDCGAGDRDLVTIDPIDPPSIGCERVTE